jgi:hypothetical protein
MPQAVRRLSPYALDARTRKLAEDAHVREGTTHRDRIMDGNRPQSSQPTKAG